MAKTIGRYEIREELGRGGMSAVYLAYDPRLHREVALKLMDQQLSTDPAFAARFEREARTVAALEHSAVVALYDYGESGGWLYLVMPYMKGGSLKALIAQGSLSARRSYNVLRRIGSALDKAHGKDIIHRDLKPANILLDEEREAYLSDFGIVKVARGDTEYLTQTGQTIGTFAYMSPEQLMGEPMDGRSDLYALGIVLYEMLTGKHPYGDDNTTDAAMAVAHTQAPIPDVAKDNLDLPAACTDIIYKALAKRPADRYATGRDMALDMYRALTARPPTAVAAARQPTPAVPAVQRTAAPVDQEKPAPAAVPRAATPPPQAKAPPVSTPQTSPKPTEAATGKARRATSKPLPRWIMVLLGLATILFGILYVTNPISFVSDAYVVLYWPIVGFLTGISLLPRLAGWRWRLPIAVLGIGAFVLAVWITNVQTAVTVAGLAGALIGLIQIVNGFRGAGLALVALGGTSLILGAQSTLALRFDFLGLAVILGGIAAVLLTFVKSRPTKKAV
jgi:serine/threonine-protein kinase